jgi:hypothetical protein
MLGLAFLIYWLVERNRRNLEIKRVLNTRVFLVTLPKEIHHVDDREQTKDFRQLISVAEQMFSAFSSLYSANISNQILQEQEQISFEIIAQNGLISFYVSCPKMIEEMVVKQIQSQYPTANLEKVQNPNIFQIVDPSGVSQNGDFAAATFKLNKKFVLPLKTYTTLENDPLSSITNTMSKLGEGANMAFQMIIRPAGENWRIPVITAVKKVQEGKTSVLIDKWYIKAMHAFFDGLSGAINAGASAAQNKPAELDKNQYKPMTPIQDSLMKALNEKASKNGFKTTMRLVSVATNKASAMTNLQNLASAFAVFGTPDLNGLKLKIGDASTAKDYILRRFLYGKKSFILNTEELASIYHFPNEYIETPSMRWLLAKTMAPPTNIPQEGTIMGKSVYRDVETFIRIKPDDRRRHIFMIGKTGVGKTTLFTNMIEQDIIEGKGCCYIDPLGDAIEDLLGKIPPERQKDVILFDPADTAWPAGLNLLEYKSVDDRDFLIQECIEIFYKLFDPNRTGIVGPQWEHWFRNAALTIMAQPDGGTLIDIPRIFTDDAYRDKLISYVTDPVIKGFWEQQMAKTADFHKSEMYNYFISKFGRFMTNDMMRNIIGQKKSAFDFRQIMDEGKILLVNLSKGKIGEVNMSLLGLVIVNKIQMAAFSRAEIPEETRRDFYLYVDEFQNFATDSFASILSEARKYRLSLNITNQYIAQLSEKIRDAVIGNAGTMITYRIGASDAEFLVKEFPGLSIEDMTNLDKFTTYVKLLIDGAPSKPFSMKGIKSETVSDPAVREAIRNQSRQNYCRPLEEINAQMAADFAVAPPVTPPPTGSNGPLNNL